MISFQIFLYINNSTRINQVVLAIYLGLGLLTKGVFLLFIPVLVLLITFINFRRKLNLRQNALSLLIFVFIFSSLGSYKAVQNMIHFHHPIVMNIDFRQSAGWLQKQRHTYIGLKSIFDINTIKLCMHPSISEQTKHSYPLLLYGSFWYQYFPRDYGLKMNKATFKYFGSLIYFFAFLPTVLFLIGFLRIACSIKDVFRRTQQDEAHCNKVIYEITLLLLLLSVLVMIIFLGRKYDIWSWFHSRYLFSSFFSIILLFHSGLDYIKKRCAVIQKAVYLWLSFLYLLFTLYYGIGIIS